MDIQKEEIDNQIEKIKKMINQNKSEEQIKTEQRKLNEMLEEYLNINKK